MSVNARIKLRRGWIWALFASSALSAWALWWPEPDVLFVKQPAPDTNLVPPDARLNRSAGGTQLIEPVVAQAALDTASSDGYRLSLAVADPFGAASSPAAPAKAMQKPATPPDDVQARLPLPSLAQPSTVPPASHYFGRLRSPDGTWHVFLTDAGASGGTTLAAPGAVLTSGWQVVEVSGQAVRLERPGSQEPGVAVPLPAMTQEDGR